MEIMISLAMKYLWPVVSLLLVAVGGSSFYFKNKLRIKTAEDDAQNQKARADNAQATIDAMVTEQKSQDELVAQQTVARDEWKEQVESDPNYRDTEL